MDWIKKLFGQHPFVYLIDGKYYAFGTNVCAEFNNGSVLLKSRYERYLMALDKKVDEDEAWDVFHELVAEASALRCQNEGVENTLTKFNKMNFDQRQITELAKQVQQYVEYYVDNKLFKHGRK